MFRHQHFILRELVINALPSYTSILNAAVGNTIYNKIIINYNYNQYNYRWTPISAGDMFQNLLRLRETADNTERYI